MRVPASGGTPEALTAVDAAKHEASHRCSLPAPHSAARGPKAPKDRAAAGHAQTCGTLHSMTPAIGTRPGRNQPCHCGSGRKYKHCCLEKDDAQAASARATAAVEAAAQSSEPATSAPARDRKPYTHQPWKASSTRGFVPRTRTPRKVGGS